MQDRRTTLKQIGIGIAAVSAGTGVGAARGAGGEKGIVETAEELGFTTLLAAVRNADPAVAATLTNDDQYTVFAPTNRAFEDFFATVEEETRFTRADVLDDRFFLLTTTLLYHVTEGRRPASSVVNAPEIETLLGEPVSVDGRTLDGRAEITVTDVEASNGIIHAIDAVLTTPTVDQLLLLDE